MQELLKAAKALRKIVSPEYIDGRIVGITYPTHSEWLDFFQAVARAEGVAEKERGDAILMNILKPDLR